MSLSLLDVYREAVSPKYEKGKGGFLVRKVKLPREAIHRHHFPGYLAYLFRRFTIGDEWHCSCGEVFHFRIVHDDDGAGCWWVKKEIADMYEEDEWLPESTPVASSDYSLL